MPKRSLLDRLHDFFFPYANQELGLLPHGDPTIGEFYDADPRRRETNTPFGEDWTLGSDPGYRYDVFWIEATGELFTMRAFKPHMGFVGNPTNGSFSSVVRDNSDPTARVLGKLTHEQVDLVMHGWQKKVGDPNSLQWVKDRVREVQARKVPE